MRWLKKLFCYSMNVIILKNRGYKMGSLVCQIANEYPHGRYDIRAIGNGYLNQAPQQMDLGWVDSCNKVNSILTGKVTPLHIGKATPLHIGKACNALQIPFLPCHRYCNIAGKESYISRNWLAQLWVEKTRTKMRRRRAKKLIDQPPISQYHGGFLSPGSLEEVKLEPLLSRANLVIARDIEWANIMFAFEQESRYVIMDACFPQSPVAFILEKSNVIFRQLLRTRRPFIAHITDPMGNEIFRVRRPFWLINSTIYAEVDGKEVGVVHRRWHLWKRIYDLYLGNKQFAVVENPGFWNWTFTLKDEEDNVLAQIDRNWRGIGLELFTDAGQYAIRFGNDDSRLQPGQASSIEELEVARPLTISERAVAVALAVSLDSDYFSRRGGWGLPILVAGE